MLAELIKEAFDQYFQFPLHAWEAMADLGEVVPLKKEQTIKKSESTENHLYLIIEGSGGIILWNKNNFICTDMLFEGEFICDYLSLLTREPTPYEVLAFEPSKFFRISYQNFQQFTASSEYGDKIWRYANQALYIDKQYQQLQLLTLTALERYQLMLQYQPFIIQRIPQKYIASYLGVTPQSLSRIRNQVE